MSSVSAQTRTPVVLGTATPGGGFPLYGAAFAEMVNAQEPRLEVRTQNTKGSAENLPLLEAGKLDLGLVAGELATAANTVAAAPRPDLIHPGVQQYLRQAGLLR